MVEENFIGFKEPSGLLQRLIKSSITLSQRQYNPVHILTAHTPWHVLIISPSCLRFSFQSGNFKPNSVCTSYFSNPRYTEAYYPPLPNLINHTNSLNLMAGLQIIKLQETSFIISLGSRGSKACTPYESQRRQANYTNLIYQNPP
jgi:hypothetical protein